MIVALLLFFLLFPVPALASSQSVVIVNQVRGTECCEPGNVEHLTAQLDLSTELNIPMTFTLRYDAVNDSRFTALILDRMKMKPELIRTGAFLEITPALAKAAGVLYTAAERDWYKTANAYPPGYSPEDRRALIDAYMESYKNVFGRYPQLTNAWFIDTYSLNYLREKYGVLVHEITREQWGTDSYTLSGGPLHYPYPAGTNWAFLPGTGGITVIRQTVTDPVYNYGDMSSSFTSQPNDYGHDKDFSYFRRLLDNALNQPEGQGGFAVLGLENSMQEKYQQEYAAQLKYLREKYPDAVYPDPAALVELSGANPVSVYRGPEAIWITAPRYRLRLVQQGTRMSLTDFRVYDQDLKDPYFTESVISGGYYIAPYLIDGSRWFRYNHSWVSNLTKPNYNEGYITRNDLENKPTHVSLPPIAKGEAPDIKVALGRITLSYRTGDGRDAEFIFSEPGFTANHVTPKDFTYHDFSGRKLPVTETRTDDSYRLSWQNENDEVIYLEGKCMEGNCEFAPGISAPVYAKAVVDQPFLLLPDTLVSDDYEGSQVYPSLKYLVFGRTPARIVIIPRTLMGNPVSLSAPVTFDSPGLRLISDPLALQGEEVQFYDFEADAPGTYDVSVSLPGTPDKKMKFVFAPNCRGNMMECVKRPGDLFSYLRAVLAARFRR